MEGQDTAALPAQHPQAMMMRSRRGRGQFTRQVRSIPPATGVRSGGQQNATPPRRHTTVPADTRVTVQPPICAVQPGRLLSLRSSLGLAQARAMLAQQQQQQQQQLQRREMAASAADSAPPRTPSSGGQLKHARLQPLGVVGTDLYHPQQFLGVVPVTPLRKLPAGRRPQSCTAPETHLLPPDHTHPQSAEVGVVKAARKRSYSAVHLPRNVSDEALKQLLYISRHAGLSHQREGACPEDQLDMELQHITRQAEFMKIEMKGLRKNFRKERPKSRSNSQRRKVHAEGEGPSSSERPPLVDKLPRIPYPSDTTTKDATEDVGTRLSVTVTKSRHEHDKGRSPRDKGRTPRGIETSPPDSSDANTSAPFPPTVSSTPGGQGSMPGGGGQGSTLVGGGRGSVASYGNIVSVGENQWAELRASGHGTGTSRHSSGRSQGRLSHGWSPPQPIEPLRGSPIRSKVGGVERSEVGVERSGVRDERTSPTASMVIDVNVAELILNGD